MLEYCFLKTQNIVSLKLVSLKLKAGRDLLMVEHLVTHYYKNNS